MGGGIAVHRHTIDTARNHRAVLHHHGAEWPATLIDIIEGKRDGFVQKTFRIAHFAPAPSRISIISV